MEVIRIARLSKEEEKKFDTRENRLKVMRVIVDSLKNEPMTSDDLRAVVLAGKYDCEGLLTAMDKDLVLYFVHNYFWHLMTWNLLEVTRPWKFKLSENTERVEAAFRNPKFLDKSRSERYR